MGSIKSAAATSYKIPPTSCNASWQQNCSLASLLEGTLSLDKQVFGLVWLCTLGYKASAGGSSKQVVLRVDSCAA